MWATVEKHIERQKHQSTESKLHRLHHEGCASALQLHMSSRKPASFQASVSEAVLPDALHTCGLLYCTKILKQLGGARQMITLVHAKNTWLPVP